MRKFLINVNGNQYEVEVEEVTSAGQPYVSPVAAVPSAPKAPAAPAAEEMKPSTPVPPAAPASNPVNTSAPVGTTKMTAPMPGTILDIKVKPGDVVKKGDLLMILEAMKMENEIVSPQDGIIATVNITKGSSVNSGDLLVSING
jgi:biotin carboxyl carrier protein